MPWPSTVGQQLPHAEQAFGIREKLAAYCLNPDHEIGGQTAQAFRRILGIELADLEYLAEALRAGILTAPTTNVRDNAPFGVRIPVGGLRGASQPNRGRDDLVGAAPRQRCPAVGHGLHRRVISTSMATAKHAVSEHDVVVLRTPVGAWPAGTTGAVISVYDDTLLVEIADPGGKTLDTIQVPADQLHVKHA